MEQQHNKMCVLNRRQIHNIRVWPIDCKSLNQLNNAKKALEKYLKKNQKKKKTDNKWSSFNLQSL